MNINKTTMNKPAPEEGAWTLDRSAKQVNRRGRVVQYYHFLVCSEESNRGQTINWNNWTTSCPPHLVPVL